MEVHAHVQARRRHRGRVGLCDRRADRTCGCRIGGSRARRPGSPQGRGHAGRSFRPDGVAQLLQLPERVTIRNRRSSKITIQSVGSTYRPYSSEPFYVGKVLKPGKSVTYTFGSGGNLTGLSIFNNDASSEGVRVRTNKGTKVVSC
jgi:hypothetical protein